MYIPGIFDISLRDRRSLKIQHKHPVLKLCKNLALTTRPVIRNNVACVFWRCHQKLKRVISILNFISSVAKRRACFRKQVIDSFIYAFTFFGNVPVVYIIVNRLSLSPVPKKMSQYISTLFLSVKLNILQHVKFITEETLNNRTK